MTSSAAIPNDYCPLPLPLLRDEPPDLPDGGGDERGGDEGLDTDGVDLGLLDGREYPLRLVPELRLGGLYDPRDVPREGVDCGLTVLVGACLVALPLLRVVVLLPDVAADRCEVPLVDVTADWRVVDPLVVEVRVDCTVERCVAVLVFFDVLATRSFVVRRPYVLRIPAVRTYPEFRVL